jgi:hypothetical protein
MNESDKDSCTASSALPHPGEVPQRRRKKKSANRASSATERNHSDTFSEVGTEGVAYTAGPASAASTGKSNRTTSLDDNITERFSRATISDERDRVKIVKSPPPRHLHLQKPPTHLLQQCTEEQSAEVYFCLCYNSINTVIVFCR